MKTQCALCVRNATQTVDVLFNGHATRLEVCDAHVRELKESNEAQTNEEAFQAELKHYRETRDAWAKDNDDLYGRSA